jgi:hypothetical protein
MQSGITSHALADVNEANGGNLLAVISGRQPLRPEADVPQQDRHRFGCISNR